MNRLEPWTRDQLDETGVRLWRAVTGGRRGDATALVGADGGLIGPFNALLRVPSIGLKLADLGEAVRFEGSIDARIRELCILTVSAHWRCGFEWWAHERYARDAGIDDEIIEDLAREVTPGLRTDAERHAHRLTRSLLHEGRIDDATYADAVAALGESEVAELVVLVGYYTLIAFTLNAFAVEVPHGGEPPQPR